MIKRKRYITVIQEDKITDMFLKHFFVQQRLEDKKSWVNKGGSLREARRDDLNAQTSPNRRTGIMEQQS